MFQVDVHTFQQFFSTVTNQTMSRNWDWILTHITKHFKSTPYDLYYFNLALSCPINIMIWASFSYHAKWLFKKAANLNCIQAILFLKCYTNLVLASLNFCIYMMLINSKYTQICTLARFLWEMVNSGLVNSLLTIGDFFMSTLGICIIWQHQVQPVVQEGR